MPGLAHKTNRMVSSVFNTVERILSPRRLMDVNENQLSRLQSELRKEGKSECTIRSYLGHLKAAVRWAVGVKILPVAPAFPKVVRAPKGSMPMKGRPITAEEFDRLTASTPKVVGEEAAESWRHLLRGLWWSGLRLGEALSLRWDDAGGQEVMSIDLTCKRPMLRIPAASEKGNRDRLLPMAPEFAEFLLETPADQRRGRVFRPEVPPVADPTSHVSRVIVKIGKRAVVKVSAKSKLNRQTGKITEKVKFASAHDLRRAFGERWADRVMPNTLMQLMRHENIETTMKFYVGRNAQRQAEVIWAAFEKATQPQQVAGGNTSGNTSPADGRFGEQETSATSCNGAV